MSMAQTSLVAHEKVKNKSNVQRVRILTVLKRFKRGRTNSELASLLKMQPSTVAARVNALKASGVVEVVCERYCQITGFKAKVHGIAG